MKYDCIETGKEFGGNGRKDGRSNTAEIETFNFVRVTGERKLAGDIEDNSGIYRERKMKI